MASQQSLSLLRCPVCSASSFTVEAQDVVVGHRSDHGEQLHCGGCSARFPIVNGVPRFVPADGYAGSFGYQWNRHKSTQLDSFTGLPVSRERLFAASKWAPQLHGQTILEAGSGAGRFTEILAGTGAQVFTFDLSSAVDANRANNQRFPNVHFAQGDILNAPFQYNAFDKVICLGVIQHTPDPCAAFRSLARHVKPGGSIVIDCYSSHLTSLLHWKYLLRPITTRMDKQRLYSIIENVVPPLLPVAATLSNFLGPVGARLLPILQYRHLGLSPELNRQWSILDTFDMYSPAFDRPQTTRRVRRWFEECGLIEIDVRRGANGIVASGRRPP
jgi:SAM-dependent methyltransferase